MEIASSHAVLQPQACRPWGFQDQLTLSQPGGADYAHHITTSTPGFTDLTTALNLLVFQPQNVCQSVLITGRQ